MSSKKLSVKKNTPKTASKKTTKVKAKTKKSTPKAITSMDAEKRYLVVGNWKANPKTIVEARSIFNGIKNNVRQIQLTDIVVCPPFVYLDNLNSLYKGKKITLGSQTIFSEQEGSYTGEVGGEMVKSVGASYTIVGHSERRKMGETDEDVKLRVNAALTAGLAPIICIGEKERDSDGDYLGVIRDQIQEIFYGTSRDWFRKVVIAYEPIWAIGKNSKGAVTMHALHETAIYIRKILSELFDKKTALSATVLYGGSVNASNASELIDGTQIDGFLVGRASLEAESFLEIINTVEKYARKK